MTRFRLRLAGVAITALGALVAQGGAHAQAGPKPPPPLTTLQAGATRVIEVPLRVNVVFVGYGQGTGDHQVQVDHFLAGLPHQSTPIVRVPNFGYGIVRPLPLHITYDYRVVFANQQFENGLFAYLAQQGRAGPPTLFQRLYNQQRSATRHVDSNLMLDAVDTERWLGQHAGSIDVDPTQHTIFFLNWWGRADFRDHLYVKPGDVDPDTGLTDATNDFGPGDAWGGTTPDDPQRPLGSLMRIWFYDSSAALDFQDASWNVDDAGGPAGSRSYRMPRSGSTATRTATGRSTT